MIIKEVILQNEVIVVFTDIFYCLTSKKRTSQFKFIPLLILQRKILHLTFYKELIIQCDLKSITATGEITSTF